MTSPRGTHDELALAHSHGVYHEITVTGHWLVNLVAIVWTALNSDEKSTVLERKHKIITGELAIAIKVAFDPGRKIVVVGVFTSCKAQIEIVEGEASN